MPKISKPADSDTSAALSSNVVIRNYRNQTIVSAVTRPRKSNSHDRQRTINRFREANKWAKNELKNPETRALYAKGVNSRLTNPHTVAVSDYLQAPVIHYINLKEVTGSIGDPIRVKATDNFRVTQLVIVITNAKGHIVEEGFATQYPRKPSMWLYRLTLEHPDIVTCKILAMAWDLPNNKTRMTGNYQQSLLYPIGHK